jgi:hypothetical protein
MHYGLEQVPLLLAMVVSGAPGATSQWWSRWIQPPNGSGVSGLVRSH